MNDTLARTRTKDVEKRLLRHTERDRKRKEAEGMECCQSAGNTNADLSKTRFGIAQNVTTEKAKSARPEKVGWYGKYCFVIT